MLEVGKLAVAVFCKVKKVSGEAAKNVKGEVVC